MSLSLFTEIALPAKSKVAARINAEFIPKLDETTPHSKKLLIEPNKVALEANPINPPRFSTGARLLNAENSVGIIAAKKTPMIILNGKR